MNSQDPRMLKIFCSVVDRIMVKMDLKIFCTVRKNYGGVNDFQYFKCYSIKNR